MEQEQEGGLGTSSQLRRLKIVQKCSLGDLFMI